MTGRICLFGEHSDWAGGGLFCFPGRSGRREGGIWLVNLSACFCLHLFFESTLFGGRFEGKVKVQHHEGMRVEANVDPILINPSLVIGGCSPPTVMIIN